VCINILIKKAFKQAEGQKRNQHYHDKLLVDDAVRRAAQASVELTYGKNRKNEVVRENREQKIEMLKRSVNQDKLIRSNTESLFPSSKA
jgi:hypothetical protein